jgi:hypothetical protein
MILYFVSTLCKLESDILDSKVSNIIWINFSYALQSAVSKSYCIKCRKS